MSNTFVVNKQDSLRRLENLSKIEVSPHKHENFIRQVEAIRIVISSILDIKCNLEPMASVHEISLEMVRDITNQRNDREAILSMAPEDTKDKIKQLNYFVVPKVL